MGNTRTWYRLEMLREPNEEEVDHWNAEPGKVDWQTELSLASWENPVMRQEALAVFRKDTPHDEIRMVRCTEEVLDE